MSKTILFATDFSHLSQAALEYATKMARQDRAKLLIVHVLEPLMAGVGAEIFLPVVESPTIQAREILRAVVPHDASVACEHRLLEGDPATEIVRLARDRDCSMIVLGTHGRRGLTRLLTGSVAEAVLRQAHCPVLAVKQPAEVLAAQNGGS